MYTVSVDLYLYHYFCSFDLSFCIKNLLLLLTILWVLMVFPAFINKISVPFRLVIFGFLWRNIWVGYGHTGIGDGIFAFCSRRGRLYDEDIGKGLKTYISMIVLQKTNWDGLLIWIGCQMEGCLRTFGNTSLFNKEV